MNIKEFNIYATYNAEHNFESSAWITNEDDGLTEDPLAAWGYTLPESLDATSVILYYGSLVVFDFDVKVFDAVSGELIPGKLDNVPNGPLVKMLYTFQNPLLAGRKIKYQVSSSTIPKQDLKFMLNVTVVFS